MDVPALARAPNAVKVANITAAIAVIEVTFDMTLDIFVFTNVVLCIKTPLLINVTLTILQIIALARSWHTLYIVFNYIFMLLILGYLKFSE